MVHLEQKFKVFKTSVSIGNTELEEIEYEIGGAGKGINGKKGAPYMEGKKEFYSCRPNPPPPSPSANIFKKLQNISVLEDATSKSQGIYFGVH